MARPLEPTDIDVAFSYVTGDRATLRPIVDALEKRLGEGRVFVDYLYEEYLNGDHARALLDDIYRERATLVIRCRTPEYGIRNWTAEENFAINNRSMRYKNRSNTNYCHEVMDFWLSTADVRYHEPAAIHVMALEKTPEEVVELVNGKLALARQHRLPPIDGRATRSASPSPTAAGNESAAKADTPISKADRPASRVASRPTDDTIPRPSIVAQIERAVGNADTRVVVVHGGEGTGKSTVLAQWLDARRTDESILLHTTAVACVAHAGNLESLIVDLVADRFDLSPDEAADVIGIEKASTPVCLVIDGINERGEVAVWADLLRQALESPREALRLVAVTRSEHWGRVQVALRLPASSAVESPRRRLAEVLVPPFTLDEVRRYLARFGAADRFSAEVMEALRIPRLLEIAARHIDRLSPTTAPTYAALHLIEFESRYGADFLSELATRVGAEFRAASGAEPRLDDYVDMLRKTLDNIGDLRSHDAQVWVALGVWLRTTLMPHADHLHDELIERIEQTLGTSEHDARATILEYATTSALLDPASPPSIRIALIDRWLTCRNRYDPPARRLGKLLTIAPRHILDAVEKAVAASGHPQLADEFVDVLVRAVRGQAGDLVLERFRTWLGYYNDRYPLPDSARAEAYAVEVDRLAAAAASVHLRVRKVGDRECALRTLALSVLLAAPDLVDAEMVRAAISSMAIDRHLDDTRLLEWLLRRLPTDHARLYVRLQHECEPSPELCRNVACVIWRADPASADRVRVDPRVHPGSKIWYLELADNMQDPGWRPSPSPRDRMLGHFRRIADRRHFDEAGMSLDDHALRHCAGGLAIHRPVVLRRILTAMSRRSADTPLRARNSQLAFLRQFADGLSDDAIAALRADASQPEDATDPTHDFSRMDYSLIVQQRMRPRRRAAQIARLTRQRRAWGELLENAGPDADAAHAFTQRCLRATNADERDAWLFVLRYCKSFRRETRELLTEWLTTLDWSSLSKLSRERAEILAWRIDAGAALAKAVENDTNLSDAASIVIAESPGCTLENAMRRCAPSRWALWCESHAATQEQCRELADVLYAIGTGQNPDTLSPSARETVDTWRNRGGRNGSLFQQSGLRYWLAVIPDYLGRWLSADVEPVPLADLVEAAVDRSDRAALPLVRQLWTAEFRGSSYTRRGLLRNVVSLAFRLPDLPEVRVLWAEMLAEVRDDDELLRVVVSALAGNGRRWLRDLVDTQTSSRKPFEHVRASVIAAFADFGDVVRQIEKNLPTRLPLNWVERAHRYAVTQWRLHRHAIAWYTRFRRTTDPMTRCGAWLQLLRTADVRFLELELPVALDRTDAATYHLGIHDEALRKAVSNRQDEHRKTLLGATLPMSNTGWLARGGRRL